MVSSLLISVAIAGVPSMSMSVPVVSHVMDGLVARQIDFARLSYSVLDYDVLSDVGVDTVLDLVSRHLSSGFVDVTVGRTLPVNAAVSVGIQPVFEEVFEPRVA